MKLLIVDDEPIICHSLKRAFCNAETAVLTAGTIAAGWERFEKDRPDVIVIDLQLPDGSGLDLFRRIRAADIRCPVIFLTAHATTEIASEVIKLGAIEFLTKPIDLEQMREVLVQAFDTARLMQKPAILPDDPSSDRIVGRSPAILETCRHISRYATEDVPVLILGESGTGKELVARAIYTHSKRVDKPFLAIKCSAIPEGLLESELFGHEKGATTGVERRRVGRIEQFSEGTLLLDEIGDLPLATQARLLRLLREHRFDRLGGSQSITTGVRLLAATNQDIEQLIAGGRFRHDLYHQLKTAIIRIPPLRERKEDIPELAHHFLFKYAREANCDVLGFSSEALELFQRYDWPGNIRELEKRVQAATCKATGPMLLPTDFPTLCAIEPLVAFPLPASESHIHNLTATIEGMLSDGKREVHSRVIAMVERELFVRALRQTRGNQSQASELLGIYRATLRNKLKELGIALDKVVVSRLEPDEG
jgi:two-component system nitrogen regulation response regulator GlnG